MASYIGKTLGKVQVERLLARGGMAEVYSGTHTTLARPVAIKVLLQHLENDQDIKKRFEREARVVATLRHPNILQIFDFDITDDGQPYIIMEFLQGVPLSSYLRSLHSRGKRLSAETILRLIKQISNALQYAHNQGVIHRDIKPANIMLVSKTSELDENAALPADVEPVLTDFGLVHLIDAPGQTSRGTVAGTPAYMSPEQASGDTIDARSDIYSLGIVIYEMLAGQVPFEADTSIGVLMKQIKEEPTPIVGLAPSLQFCLDRALAKDPRDRFQTASELADEFKASFEAGLDPTEPPSRQTNPPRTLNKFPKAKKNRSPIPLIAGVVAILLAIIGFQFFKSPPENIQPTETTVATSAVSGQSFETFGVVTFQDLGGATASQATLFVSGAPALESGSQYEAWLVGLGGESRISLGIVNLDESGQATLTLVDPNNRNFLTSYNIFEITVEPNPDASPNPSSEVAFSFVFPPDAFAHIRHLLVGFSNTPNQTALISGLVATTSLVNNEAQAMLAAAQSGDEAAVRRSAEAIVNMTAGSQNLEQYKDWDGDGALLDPSDGFGLLLNGDNVGYIHGVYSHAEYATNTVDTSENIRMHGDHVMISTQNMEGWAPQLRDLAIAILQSPFDASTIEKVNQAAQLADQLLNGIDLNGNEAIEPTKGEGGAMTAHDHAIYMANMELLAGINRLPKPAPPREEALPPNYGP